MKADNGPPFQGVEFATYCKNFGIDLTHSIPYWAQQNGQAERTMKNITRALSTSKIDGIGWEEALERFQLSYNATPHSVTNVAPRDAINRRKTRGLLPSYKVDDFYFDEDIRDRDRIAKFKGKITTDRKRKAVPTEIKVGDTVLIHSKQTGKLKPNFDAGLHTVIARNDGALKLRSEDNVIVERFVAQVKKWPPEIGDDMGEQVEEADAQNTQEIVETETNSQQVEPTKQSSEQLTKKQRVDELIIHARPARHIKVPEKLDL